MSLVPLHHHHYVTRSHYVTTPTTYHSNIHLPRALRHPQSSSNSGTESIAPSSSYTNPHTGIQNNRNSGCFRPIFGPQTQSHISNITNHQNLTSTLFFGHSPHFGSFFGYSPHFGSFLGGRNPHIPPRCICPHTHNTHVTYPRIGDLRISTRLGSKSMV
jgi:hypothetical protein